MNKNLIVTILTVASALGLTGPLTALAATAPSLGVASSSAIVASTWTNTGNAGLETAITGAVCYSIPPDTAPISINGVTTTPLGQATNPCSPAIAAAQAAALVILNSQACTSLGTSVALNAVIIPGHPAGTFPPGCYSSSLAMTIALSTNVTLDGPGAYVFRSGGALTTGANSNVLLTNGATAGDVFWAPVGTASIGANAATSVTSTFVGTIIADALGSASPAITIGHFANLLGRALAFGHTVITDANTITVPGASSLATLHVIKLVVGGTGVSSDFTVSVKNASSTDVSGSPLAGAISPGTAYSLAAGAYTVSEVAVPFYAQTFSGDCDSSGNVSLSAGGNEICTVINTDIPRGSTATIVPPAVPPLISITKVPTPLALPAGFGAVTYNYTVLNVGTVAMSNVSVTDNKCASVAFVSGDTNSDSKLDVSETWKYSCTVTLSETTTNSVTATGQANGLTATDFANATVVVGKPIVPPLIHLVKKPSAFVLSAGGLVTYSYTVDNPGVVALSDVKVVDNKCSPVFGPSGDANANGMLDVSETWTYACQMNLTANTVNTATATGKANGLIAIDYSIATVIVSSPKSFPKLPNTGLPPESAPWGMVLFFGLALAGLTAIVKSLKKSKI